MTSDDSLSNNRPGFWRRLAAAFSNSENEFDDTQVNAETGVVEPQTPKRREMIERVIAFDQKKVVEVMAPRADIFAVDVETPLQELIDLFAEAGHSRMPIYRGDLDDPIGMIHIKDVVAAIAGKTEKNDLAGPILKSLRRDILYVPPSMLVTDLLLRMQASRIHMALVIDEYGGTDGLATIEDLIEEIVGDINDEHDETEMPEISDVGANGWNVDARVELSELESVVGIGLDSCSEEEVDTVGGFVVSLAGRVPQRGEVVNANDRFEFEIIEADARKVRKLRIRPSTNDLKDAAE